MTKRVLVCGGRTYGDAQIEPGMSEEEETAEFDRADAEVDKLKSVLHALASDAEVIIAGCAKGADRCARKWARAERIKLAVFVADWYTYGPAAGPLRNQRMIDDGKPTLVIAFPGGRGTADMVRRARTAGIPVEEIK